MNEGCLVERKKGKTNETSIKANDSEWNEKRWKTRDSSRGSCSYSLLKLTQPKLRNLLIAAFVIHHGGRAHLWGLRKVLPMSFNYPACITLHGATRRRWMSHVCQHTLESLQLADQAEPSWACGETPPAIRETVMMIAIRCDRSGVIFSSCVVP